MPPLRNSTTCRPSSRARQTTAHSLSAFCCAARSGSSGGLVRGMAAIVLSVIDRRRVIDDLQAEGLDVTEWTDEPGTHYTEHTHPRDEVLVVLAPGLETTVTRCFSSPIGPVA